MSKKRSARFYKTAYLDCKAVDKANLIAHRNVRKVIIEHRCNHRIVMWGLTINTINTCVARLIMYTRHL